jgi:hypothetical protein
MKRKFVLLFVSLGLTSVAVAGPPTRFDAQLSGFNAGGAVVDTNAAGVGKVEIVDNGTAIYYQINVAGLDGAFMAHIHVANAPVRLTDPAGPVVVWFFGGPPPVAADAISERINGSLARGYIVTAADLASGTVADLIAAIREGRASIIVHTVESPAGELRGTLR